MGCISSVFFSPFLLATELARGADPKAVLLKLPMFEDLDFYTTTPSIHHQPKCFFYNLFSEGFTLRCHGNVKLQSVFWKLTLNAMTRFMVLLPRSLCTELSADHTLNSTVLGDAETEMEGTSVLNGCMEKSGLLAWNIQSRRLHKRRNLKICILEPPPLRISFLGRCVLP